MIAETGFGTGLNFLATWRLFEQSECLGILEFVSVEKYPLKKDDLTQALKCFPELEQYSQRLVEVWNHLYSGVHRIKIAPRVYLTLHIGDVQDTFLNTSYTVDAWYLDGFAPSKNPDMWSSELFKGMANHSCSKSTFATFTAAGIVKRGLKDAGFDVQKTKGFGRKRDMLVGTLASDVFHVKPEWFHRNASQNVKNILIVGSGLAGANAASAFAHYGCSVTVVEKENEIASKASGNPLGLSKPPVKLGVDTPLYEFGESGFLHGLNQKEKQDSVCLNGVMSLWSKNLDKDKADEFLSRRSFDGAYISENESGLNSAIGMVIEPKKYVQNLLAHPNVQVVSNTDFDDYDSSDFDAVVLATGCDVKKFIPEIRPVRGQISYLKPDSKKTKAAYSYGGYAIYAEDLTLIGATFDHNDFELELREGDHEHNLSEFNKALNQSKTMDDIQGGRVSWRATTPDHLPIAGPIYSKSDFWDKYASALRGGKDTSLHDSDLLPEVFMIGGLGSHGLNYASLSADVLLHHIAGAPAPVSNRLLKSVHPMRFFVRQIQKNQVSRETLKEDK